MSSPRVSIVLLCYNKLELTRACIESLVASDPEVEYEVIVVDNGSDDDTPAYLSCLEGDVHIESIYPNIGFIRANNQGAKHATGEFILFLNNDTVLLPGWLDPLVELMDEDPLVGAVSPMLIFPDGRVNDAGGLTFADGECYRYGMWDEFPDNPALQCRRAVDYAMGACLLVRRNLWEQIGGFDECFIPAYYEDVDLSFSIRSLGYKVMYEPASRIIHVEGGTNGTDTQSTEGHKQYQVVNRQKFADKWADELAHRPKMQDSIIQNWAHRGQGGFGPGETPAASWNEAIVRSQDAKSILIVDPLAPLKNRNAGHERLWHIIEQLRAMGHSVSYFSDSSYLVHEIKTKLSKIGVPLYGLDARFATGPDERPSDLALSKLVPNFIDWGARQQFDVVMIDFWYMAEKVMKYLKYGWPNATYIIDTVDVHFVREYRQAELRGDPQMFATARANKDLELAMYSQADRLIACTEPDAETLRQIFPSKDISVMTTIHEATDPGPEFEDREGLFFVGNFSHPANPDAIMWWRDEIAERLEAQLPGVRLTVVGHDPAQIVPRIIDNHFNALGWQEDLTPHLHRARISVAPLRFGAGMKGKVGEALGAGLPVVGTKIAVEGMDLVDGEQVLVADNAEQFVEQIVRLYNDRDLWMKLRDNGREAVSKRWGPESLREPLSRLFLPKVPKNVGASKSKVKGGRYTPPAKARSGR